jgi:uncharacterized membrane protein YhaH (DUF805 family)
MADRGNGRRPEVAMDWVWYLFGFEGRINRAKYWLAGLVILCWMMFLAVLTFGIAALFRTTGLVDSSFSVDDLFNIVDPASYRSRSWAELPALVVKAAGTFLFLWFYLATSVKRLHDRDKSAWWMLPFFVVPGLVNQFGNRLPENTYLIILLAAISCVLCLWGLVELYNKV